MEIERLMNGDWQEMGTERKRMDIWVTVMER